MKDDIITQVLCAVSDAVGKELEVWKGVYQRDGYIPNRSWLGINVSLQGAAIDELLKQKQFSGLDDRTLFHVALEAGKVIEEMFRSFQTEIKEHIEEYGHEDIIKSIFEVSDWISQLPDRASFLEVRMKNEWAEWAEAFTIFSKYPHTGESNDELVSAQRDEVFAGPNPSIVDEVDRQRLQELGWDEEVEFECFHKYT